MSRTSYIIRDMSRDESRDFGDALKRARGEGRSMRWIVLKLITLYARVGLNVLERAAGEEP
ncbi:MAG TPA: hypothetical protein VKE91_00475 [Blastocatellia bacterium]|nr:hypothetical protein [Blastocatellia bacterium]